MVEPTAIWSNGSSIWPPAVPVVPLIPIRDQDDPTLYTILRSNALKPDHYRDHVSGDPSSNLKTTGFLTTNEH
jgi:hypothetical protein